MTEEEFKSGYKKKVIVKEEKDTNPKDAVGIKKVPMSTVPSAVMAEVGLGMMEGARKYGRHNYRSAGIRASVYYDAALRHLFQWWEGEDIDPDSGLSHIIKCLATLTVLRDGMLTKTWTDDRPPALREGWMNELNKKAGELVEKYPTSVPAYCNFHSVVKEQPPVSLPLLLAEEPKYEDHQPCSHSLSPNQLGLRYSQATEPLKLLDPVAQADYGNVEVFRAGTHEQFQYELFEEDQSITRNLSARSSK